jgi:hypothetical protein
MAIFQPYDGFYFTVFQLKVIRIIP